MSAWLSKWGPVSGVLSTLLAVASLVTGSSTPDSDQAGAQVIQWYTVHHNQRIVSGLLAGLAMLFFVAFAAVLVGHVRRGGRWIAAGALAGAACAAIGLTSILGFDLVLATDTKNLTPGSAQTLNLLQNDFFLPLVVGIALFAILGGLAVAAGRILPAAAGWVLFAVGIAALVPPVAWFALLATLLWVLVAGIWLTRQGPPAVGVEPAAAGERVPSLT
jgi:hypothetical protein